MNLKIIVVSLSLIFALLSNSLEISQDENLINQNISNEPIQDIVQIEEVYEDNSYVVEEIDEIENIEKIPEIKSEIDNTEEKLKNNTKNEIETKEIEQKNVVQNTDKAQINNTQNNENNKERTQK